MRGLELSIAWRYLRSRRGSRLLSLISVIAIGGVLLGVSALIVIMGVMNGLQRDLRDKILVGSPDLRALPYGSDMRLPDWASVRDEVLTVQGVVAAAPFVNTQGLVRNACCLFTTGAQVRGLRTEDLAAKPPLLTSLTTHDRQAFADGQGALPLPEGIQPQTAVFALWAIPAKSCPCR